MSTTTSVYGFVKHARGDTPWDVEANADFDGIDAEIARPRLPFNSPTVGATTTCDLSLARVFVFTVSQATTLSFTNVPAATFAVRIRLLITNGSAFLITWPAAVSWLAGIAPTFKASGVDEVELLTKDAGVTWYATLRNLKPGLLYQNQSLSTTSTSEVSLATYTLPANAMTVNGNQLRITLTGSEAVQTGLIRIKFGATSWSTFTTNVGYYVLTYIIVRTAAATQTATGVINSATAVAINQNTSGETMSGAIVIDIRGNVVAGGTLGVNTVAIELLAVA